MEGKGEARKSLHERDRVSGKKGIAAENVSGKKPEVGVSGVERKDVRGTKE